MVCVIVVGVGCVNRFGGWYNLGGWYGVGIWCCGVEEVKVFIFGKFMVDLLVVVDVLFLGFRGIKCWLKLEVVVVRDGKLDVVVLFIFILDEKKLEGRKRGLLVVLEVVIFVGVIVLGFVLWRLVFIDCVEFCFGMGILGGGWFGENCWNG